VSNKKIYGHAFFMNFSGKTAKKKKNDSVKTAKRQWGTRLQSENNLSVLRLPR